MSTLDGLRGSGAGAFAPVRPKAVAFDIIGTAFSLEPMRERLVGLGLPAASLELWYASGLRDAFALAATGSFQPFRSVLDGALEEILARHKRSATAEERAQVLAGLKELPPHADTPEAFRALSQAGIAIVALSNGARASTQELLGRAGLDGLVEHVLSVDDIGLSKPRREVYLHAAVAAGIEPRELALVATHPWDIHGAKSAGLMAGYVERGRPFPAVMRAPDIRGETLLDVVQSFVELDP